MTSSYKSYKFFPNNVPELVTVSAKFFTGKLVHLQLIFPNETDNKMFLFEASFLTQNSKFPYKLKDIRKNL